MQNSQLPSLESVIKSIRHPIGCGPTLHPYRCEWNSFDFGGLLKAFTIDKRLRKHADLRRLVSCEKHLLLLFEVKTFLGKKNLIILMERSQPPMHIDNSSFVKFWDAVLHGQSASMAGLFYRSFTHEVVLSCIYSNPCVGSVVLILLDCSGNLEVWFYEYSIPQWTKFLAHNLFEKSLGCRGVIINAAFDESNSRLVWLEERSDNSNDGNSPTSAHSHCKVRFCTLDMQNRNFMNLSYPITIVSEDGVLRSCFSSSGVWSLHCVAEQVRCISYYSFANSRIIALDVKEAISCSSSIHVKMWCSSCMNHLEHVKTSFEGAGGVNRFKGRDSNDFDAITATTTTSFVYVLLQNVHGRSECELLVLRSLPQYGIAVSARCSLKLDSLRSRTTKETTTSTTTFITPGTGTANATEQSGCDKAVSLSAVSSHPLCCDAILCSATNRSSTVCLLTDASCLFYIIPHSNYGFLNAGPIHAVMSVALPSVTPHQSTFVSASSPSCWQFLKSTWMKEERSIRSAFPCKYFDDDQYSISKELSGGDGCSTLDIPCREILSSCNLDALDNGPETGIDSSSARVSNELCVLPIVIWKSSDVMWGSDVSSERVHQIVFHPTPDALLQLSSKQQLRSGGSSKAHISDVDCQYALLISQVIFNEFVFSMIYEKCKHCSF
jgi:hypothetical protein